MSLVIATIKDGKMSNYRYSLKERNQASPPNLLHHRQEYNFPSLVLPSLRLRSSQSL
eukprot:m.108454 g.108454  ORF g.108454 m.108454 type:complete len:57 (+) comp13965_c0_seq2:765-935(+)